MRKDVLERTDYTNSNLCKIVTELCIEDLVSGRSRNTVGRNVKRGFVDK